MIEITILSYESTTMIAYKVSKISIIVNVLLSVIKFFAGLVAHSGAMISDAIHSMSDVFSTVIVMIGVKLSSKEADKEHPYGHERLECVAAIILSIILLIVGIFIGKEGIDKIYSGEISEVPGTLALMAAVLSIAVKEAMFWYTRYYAKMIESGSLMAEAWHHRSDSLSSVGALIGIVGARMGVPILDPFASVVICFFIVKASFDIFKEAVDKMVDKSSPTEFEETLKKFIMSHKGVDKIDLLRTREFGNRIYVELEISVDGNLLLSAAHEIAKNVHDDLETRFKKVKHIMIHVNPSTENSPSN